MRLVERDEVWNHPLLRREDRHQRRYAIVRHLQVPRLLHQQIVVGGEERLGLQVAQHGMLPQRPFRAKTSGHELRNWCAANLGLGERGRLIERHRAQVGEVEFRAGRQHESSPEFVAQIHRRWELLPAGGGADGRSRAQQHDQRVAVAGPQVVRQFVEILVFGPVGPQRVGPHICAFALVVSVHVRVWWPKALGMVGTLLPPGSHGQRNRCWRSCLRFAEARNLTAVLESQSPACEETPMAFVRFSKRKRCRRGRRGIVIAVPAWCLIAAAVNGTESLSLVEAERLALGQDFGAIALLEEARAFEDMTLAAGKLPAAQIRFGVANFPVNGATAGSFGSEGMTHAQIGVRQRFPSSAERDAARQRESASAELRWAQAEERRRSVRLAVRHAWLNGFLAQRSQRLVADLQGHFTDLVDIERSLYAVGSKSQRDVLRAEFEGSQLDARLVALAQQEAQAQAALSRWIGDAAERHVADEPPNWAEIGDLPALQTLLVTHPALAAGTAQVDVESAAIALAESRLRPAWSVDVGYGYREGSQPNGLPRSDLASASVALALPLFTRPGHQRSVRAARAHYRAAIAAKDDLLRRLAADLRREHQRWHDIGRRLAVYDEAIIAHAGAVADAALAAYRSEAGDLAAVVRSHIDLLDMRLARLQLAVERHHAHAEIAYLAAAQP